MARLADQRTTAAAGMAQLAFLRDLSGNQISIQPFWIA
jgi:hypothetical protein